MTLQIIAGSSGRAQQSPFDTSRLDLYLSRKILAIAAILLILPPTLVTVQLGSQSHSYSRKLMRDMMSLPAAFVGQQAS